MLETKTFVVFLLVLDAVSSAGRCGCLDFTDFDSFRRDRFSRFGPNLVPLISFLSLARVLGLFLWRVPDLVGLHWFLLGFHFVSSCKRSTTGDISASLDSVDRVGTGLFWCVFQYTQRRLVF